MKRFMLHPTVVSNLVSASASSEVDNGSSAFAPGRELLAAYVLVERNFARMNRESAGTDPHLFYQNLLTEAMMLVRVKSRAYDASEGR